MFSQVNNYFLEFSSEFSCDFEFDFFLLILMMNITMNSDIKINGANTVAAINKFPLIS